MNQLKSGNTFIVERLSAKAADTVILRRFLPVQSPVVLKEAIANLNNRLWPEALRKKTLQCFETDTYHFELKMP